MAIRKLHSVQCRCGEQQRISLAESVNVDRAPDIRAEILAGTFHKVRCPACGNSFTAETTFQYIDTRRSDYFLVRPRGHRHQWRETETVAEQAAGCWPKSLLGEEPRVRVMFGMDELRETLVAEDAGLDDKAVELVKVLLVNEHPFALKRARLRLTLADADTAKLRFVAAYEHSDHKYEFLLPAPAAQNEAKDTLKRWSEKAHGELSITKPHAAWASIWRFSPQPDALSELKAQAARVAEGEEIDTESKPFKKMLRGLPRGAHLPGWAKQDLTTLFEYAKARELGQLQDTLFEIRFDLKLEDDWTQNKDDDDVATLWQLLRDLPDNNVEGNSKIREITLDPGAGGVYDPNTYDIGVGAEELEDLAAFATVVRHEVGHAVHERDTEKINAWLRDQFGWTSYDATQRGIDAWIEEMGGVGDITARQRAEVRGYLKTALGAGSRWYPGPKPRAPRDHPWNRPKFGPRLAYEKTGAEWFGNFRTWHRKNGRAFFLNYWYQTLVSVNADTLDLIGKMPDPYAAMSHFEFFAELYALYFDKENPARRHIPPEAMAWLAANVEDEDRALRRPARPRLRSKSDTITRPKRDDS